MSAPCANIAAVIIAAMLIAATCNGVRIIIQAFGAAQ